MRFFRLCRTTNEGKHQQSKQHSTRTASHGARPIHFADAVASLAHSAGLNFREAEQHSFEELELLAAAAERKRARDILETVQLIIAGHGDKRNWEERQRRLVKQLMTGL